MTARTAAFLSERRPDVADLPTLELQVAFDTTPKQTPTWTTVASTSLRTLRSAEIDRGRSSSLDQYEAGRATFVLDNRDRKFDPSYTAGAYYGKLLPNKRVRLRATYASVTTTRFEGFVDGWPQSYDPPNDATVVLRATDWFKIGARAKLKSAWRSEVLADSPRAWWRLGEQSGTVAADSSGNGYHGTYEGGATFNTRTGLIAGDPDNGIAFDGTDDAVASIPEAAAVTGSFSVETWFTSTGTDASFTRTIAGQGSIKFGSAGYESSFPTQNNGWALGHEGGAAATMALGFIIGNGVAVRHVRTTATSWNDEATHHVVATWNGSTAKIYVDGVDQSLTTEASGSPSGPSAGFVSVGKLGAPPVGGWWLGAADEVLIYSSALSAARVLAHYNAGNAPWNADSPSARITRVLDQIGQLAADRDLDTGSAVLGSASVDGTPALTHLQEVAASEAGRLYVTRDGKVRLIGRNEFWQEASYNTSQATFGDGTGELPYRGLEFAYDEEKVRNDIRVRPHTGDEQIATDSASQAASGGEITYSLSSLESRVRYAKDHADWLLFLHKDPVLQIGMVEPLAMRSPSTVFPVVLAAELGQRYTFKRRPQNVGSAISVDVQLEGVRERWRPGSVTFEWLLSPGEPHVWQWGTSTWETGTNVAKWGW